MRKIIFQRGGRGGVRALALIALPLDPPLSCEGRNAERVRGYTAIINSGGFSLWQKEKERDSSPASLIQTFHLHA